ncbi:hypothetical protein V6N13_141145 [Hibiscus sabdariffa]
MKEKIEGERKCETWSRYLRSSFSTCLSKRIRKHRFKYTEYSVLHVRSFVKERRLSDRGRTQVHFDRLAGELMVYCEAKQRH